MSSSAAVTSWPFNSVTNLLFLWKPQTINHCVQSGGLSWKFSTSPLSNDCTSTNIWDALLLGATFIGSEVTYFTQSWHRHGEPDMTRFASSLWWIDRRRRESFCQHSQQGEDFLCFSYSSSSFCLCHQRFAAFKSCLVSQVEIRRKVLTLQKSWGDSLSGGNLTIHLSLHKTSWKDKMTADRLL